ncbi:MAG TPA: GNAT family N-acetyltransferase [Cerasibacillus sp.]|uniref:GNAT family N-acetyltransferase n=1 Tax=Cerasibacillus sp. TaxID=2498711 RepID=UPI002F3F7FE1
MNIKVAETDIEIKDALNIRKTVFVNEQQVPLSIEMDDHDEEAIHFIGYLNEVPILASRLRFVDDYGKLERICVLKEHRGKSFGQHVIHTMESTIKDHGYTRALLNAQEHAIGFYEKLGYRVKSKPFIDAGISHVTMEKSISSRQSFKKQQSYNQ